MYLKFVTTSTTSRRMVEKSKLLRLEYELVTNYSDCCWFFHELLKFVFISFELNINMFKMQGAMINMLSMSLLFLFCLKKTCGDVYLGDVCDVVKKLNCG